MNALPWRCFVKGPRGLRLQHEGLNYHDIMAYLRGAARVAPFPPGTVATVSGPIGGERRYSLRGDTMAELADDAAVAREERNRPFLDFTTHKE